MGCAWAVFTIGADGLEKREALERKIANGEAEVVEGPVHTVIKDMVEVTTGQIAVTRRAQNFLSFSIDDVRFISGKNYGHKDLRHFNLKESPFDTGDYLRVSHVNQRVVKIQKQENR